MPIRISSILGGLLCGCGAVLLGWSALVVLPAHTQTAHDAARLAAVIASQRASVIEDMRGLLASLASDPAVASGSAEACRGALARAQAQFPQLVDVIKVGRDGRVVCGSLPLGQAHDDLSGTAFHEAFESKALSVSSRRSAATPERLMLTYPLVEAGGEVNFVLRSRLDPDWLRTRLEADAFPPGMRVAIGEPTGTARPTRLDAAARGSVCGVARSGSPDAGTVTTCLPGPWSPAIFGIAALLLGGAGLTILLVRRRLPAETGRVRPYVLGGVFLVAVAGSSLWFLREGDAAARGWVEHTFEVLAKLARARIDLDEAQAGQRGFVLTGNTLFLKPFLLGETAIGRDLADLRALVADNPHQGGWAVDLTRKAGEKFAAMRGTIDKVRNARPGEAADAIRRGSGYALMESVQLLIDRMQFEEQVLLVVRQGGEGALLHRTLVLGAASLVAALLAFLIAAAGVAHNRHERRLREAKLHEANRSMRLAEEVGHLGHWRFDAASGAMTWSEGTYRLHGVEADSFDPSLDGTLQLCHPDDREAAGRALATAIETGAPMEHDQRIVRADGTLRHLVVRGRAEREAGGGVAAVFGVYQDVTRLKQAEGQLREQEAQYRLLAENTSDMIVMGRQGERRSVFSPAVQSILGFTPEQALDLRMHELLHPDDRQNVFDFMSALGAERSKDIVTARFRRADASYVWVEAAVRFVAGPDRKPFYVASVRDITKRREVEEALRLAKETAELAQAQAETANEAKSRFVATMSHEIRTPLNAIIGFADLLSDSNRLPPDLQRHAELVRSSGLALLSIVNDILDFSKMEAGAAALDPRPFSPSALAANCMSMARGAAVAKALALELHMDDAVPRALVGDEDRLRQVLLNLLNNAIKFTQSGAVTMSLRHEGSSERGERLRFSVRDTGIGVPPSKQHRLFQRFSQVDASTAREHGGTGLGLAICKQLIQLMEGDIGVFSDEGLGSTFWFTVTLPRGTLEPRQAERQARLTPRRRANLLLVEDVPINQELGRAILEAAGHEVAVACDGSAAIAAVRTGNFDLVLMDVQMAGMDGLAAARHIRALPFPLCGVPIIAMTANVMPDQVQAYVRAGMDGHIGKPVNHDALHAMIDRVLQAQPVRPRQDDAGLDATGHAAFDAETFESIAAVLGNARMPSLLQDLGRQFERLNVGDGDVADAQRCRRETHSLVSTAGMMGFCELSEVCRGLETILAEDAQGLRVQLERIRRARDRALAQIRRLQERFGVPVAASDVAA